MSTRPRHRRGRSPQRQGRGPVIVWGQDLRVRGEGWLARRACNHIPTILPQRQSQRAPRPGSGKLWWSCRCPQTRPPLQGCPHRGSWQHHLRGTRERRRAYKGKGWLRQEANRDKPSGCEEEDRTWMRTEKLNATTEITRGGCGARAFSGRGGRRRHVLVARHGRQR